MRDYPADSFFAFSLSSETPCHKKLTFLLLKTATIGAQKHMIYGTSVDILL